MHFRSSRKKEVNLNLTPLIDVVFLLLIFFMVTTTFTRQTQIELTLPDATSEAMESDNKTMEISITADGKIYINQRALRNNEVDTVIAGIEKTIKGNLNKPMIISADKAAPYQSVVTVMDAAGQIGLNNFQLATATPSESK
jgi:biopolymer transport protein ExbD